MPQNMSTAEDLGIVFSSTIKQEEEYVQPRYYLEADSLVDILIEKGPSHVIVLCGEKCIPTCEKKIINAGITCVVLNDSDESKAASIVSSCQRGIVETIIVNKELFEPEMFPTARYLVFLDKVDTKSKRFSLSALRKKNKKKHSILPKA